MVNIEINGIPVKARQGSMLIEAADEAGITIPRFCYHKKLSVAASCRMCLVEVEKVAKPLPACATPVTEGMKVYTRSPKAISAQRNVMEFLLINHPLDCPICDQGGECDLQEMAVGYGKDVSRFREGKRAVASPDIGPLVATDMSRCIHCTRCVRFGEEVAGLMELGAPGRGEHMHIGTYVEKSLSSEVSGNVIDLCPVGALTSKPYRYTARPWELATHNSISPHDCVGANVRVDVRNGQVMRVRPRENEEVNEVWLADRDRFSYLAMRHADRLTKPQVKTDGVWQEVDWNSALTVAAERLQKVVTAHGAEQLGALAGYNATTEELYLLQKLVRGLGSNNIDHRLRQIDFSTQAQLPPFPWLGQALADVDNLDAALLVGSNVRKEQPLVALRLRKAARAGGQVMAINPLDFSVNFPLAEKRIVAPNAMVDELVAVATALLELTGEQAPQGFAELSSGVTVADSHRAIAKQLHGAAQSAVLLGSVAAYHPQQGALQMLGGLIARLAGARFGMLTEGGNSAGAWLAGAIPHRAAGARPLEQAGLDWRAMSKGLKGYLLLGLEPDLDCIGGATLGAALAQAESVVAMTAYATDALREQADVLLPMALFAETSGTLINVEGRWQSFGGCINPPDEVRPGWKVLRVLGNLCDLEGFDYLSSEEVRDELSAACSAVLPSNKLTWQAPARSTAAPGLARITDFPIYAVDGMVRRSEALQQASDATMGVAALCAATAAQLGLAQASEVRVRQSTAECVLPLQLDENVPQGCVYVPAGLAATAALGAVDAALELSAV